MAYLDVNTWMERIDDEQVEIKIENDLKLIANLEDIKKMSDDENKKKTAKLYLKVDESELLEDL